VNIFPFYKEFAEHAFGIGTGAAKMDLRKTATVNRPLSIYFIIFYAIEIGFFHYKESVINVAIFISGFTLAQIKKTVEIINKKVRKKEPCTVGILLVNREK
jgi:hypothetical protein